MGNSSKINSYNHSSNGGMTSNDIMNFISNNNLLHVHSDLGGILRCSTEVNVCFLNFFKVLRQRGENFDEKKEITSILKKSEYDNEKDLLTYLNILIKLASKKTPDGKYFIPLKYVKILADFKNLPNKLGSLQKKKQIEELIYAIEQGWLPGSSFKDFPVGDSSCIFDCSEINPLILSDIGRMKTAKGVSDKLDFSKGLNYFIPEYESEWQFRLAEQFKNLKPGSLICFKNAVNSVDNHKVFIVSEDSSSYYGPLKIGRETLLKSLPPIGRYYIEQGKIGTCYQLAGYISMMNDPHFYSYLLRRLEKKGNDVFITLPSYFTENNLLLGKTTEFDSNNQLFVKLDSNGNFNTLDSSKTVVGEPFYKALEHLYGRYRKYDYANQYIKQSKLSGKTLDSLISDAISGINKYIYIKNSNGLLIRITLDDLNNNKKLNKGKHFKSVEDYYKKSGTSFEIMDIFTPFNSSWFKTHNNYDSRSLGEDYYSYCKSDIKTLTYLRKLLLKHNFIKTFGTLQLPDTASEAEHCLMPNKGLYSNHAYSIYSYDPKTDIVKYINPWNSVFVFEMKLSELAKYINHVSVKRML